jgi:hypothetical protein
MGQPFWTEIADAKPSGSAVRRPPMHVNFSLSRRDLVKVAPYFSVGLALVLERPVPPGTIDERSRRSTQNEIISIVPNGTYTLKKRYPTLKCGATFGAPQGRIPSCPPQATVVEHYIDAYARLPDKPYFGFPTCR